MKATFMLIANDRTPWYEEDLDKDAAALARLLPGLMPLYGMLTVTDEDAHETLSVTDDFDAVTGEFCLRMVPDLAAGRAVTYIVSAHDEEVVLTPDGDRIEVEGTTVDECSFPKAAMLAALVDCGERYLAFKRKQLTDPGDRRLAMLEKALDRARAAVAG